MTKEKAKNKETKQETAKVSAENLIAVIKTGGKQYLVKQGDKVKVEKLEQEEGNALTFEDLLSGSKVTAKVTSHGKGKKVSGRVFINKTRQSRFPRGHRQQYTELTIENIK